MGRIRGGRRGERRNRRRGPVSAAALGLSSVLVLVPALGGCGTGAEGSGGVTLTVVATNYGDDVVKNSESYWNRIDTAFEAAHPGISLDVRVYDPGEAEAQVAKMVAAGDPPDIAQISGYADYAAKGDLYQADDLLSIRVQANFLPNLVDAGSAGHTQYGLPFLASTRLLYVNKTLFAEAGLEPPTTWAELRNAAQVLDERGVKYPYALPLGPEEAQAETLQWLLGGGGGYTGDTGEYDIASPRNISTLTWLRDRMVGDGLTGPVSPDRLNRKAALRAFVDGEAGMVSAPGALVREIGRSVEPVAYEAVPMPGRTAGVTTATVGTSDWIAAFKHRGHAEEIGTYLNFLYEDKNMVDLAGTYQLLPVTSSAATSMRANKTYESLWDGLDALGAAQLYPIGKPTWTATSRDIQETIGGAVLERGSPAKVLGAIQRGAAAAEAAEAEAE
ncbi:extracellular solute-binding protein [Streptomyces sp. ADMS]|uniref:extracellular solute-binding protein n=1 Tax=Streptomyces sp. ADMS TaxID=3071415 RepID=UPI00296E3931|nr:extracellular solute-binding protein [Streptomyces sp. ADMS]MDW4908787.1 extracellular solute-binding protein [Streptomyces sp. ADMS]